MPRHWIGDKHLTEPILTTFTDALFSTVSVGQRKSLHSSYLGFSHIHQDFCYFAGGSCIYPYLNLSDDCCDGRLNVIGISVTLTVLKITFHDRVTIVKSHNSLYNRLWRHRNVNRASDETNCLRVYPCVIVLLISIVAPQPGKIHQITLSWPYW